MLSTHLLHYLLQYIFVAVYICCNTELPQKNTTSSYNDSALIPGSAWSRYRIEQFEKECGS